MYNIKYSGYNVNKTVLFINRTRSECEKVSTYTNSISHKL